MKKWKLDDARSRFGEVIRHALSGEPQLVTRGDGASVVVLSAEDYEALTGIVNLPEFLGSSPLAAALAVGELELEQQDRETSRSVEL